MLLEAAVQSRVSENERWALERASDRVWFGSELDYVVLGLPQLRMARGLIFALGWAAEFEDAKDEEWRKEALSEYEKAVEWYRKTLSREETWHRRALSSASPSCPLASPVSA